MVDARIPGPQARARQAQPPVAAIDRPGLGALGTVVLIVAVLSRAPEIFVPLALAIVVAFALGPAVRLLDRAIGRVGAESVIAGVFSSVLALALGGCSAGLSSSSQTAAAGSDCAADDFATGQVVFFGLSDNLGPGTIMKRYAGKGVGPAYLVGNIIDDPTSTVVHHGVDWACALGDSVARTFDANSAVGILPVDATVNTKLARASHIEVTVDSVRWDDLLAGPFRAAIDQLSDPSLKADLLRGGYLVESRALVAKGIRVTATFERSIGASVKAALGEGRKTLQQGKVTAVVDLTWNDSTELAITAPSEVYIAGRLMNLAAGSLPSANGTPEVSDLLGQILVRM